MGIFDFLSGSDPSSDWPDLGKLPIKLSLANAAVNGIELGSPATDLAKLGRPSNKRPFKEERFLYERLGIAIEIEDKCVSYFGLPLVRTDLDDVGPCEFELQFADGHEISVTGKTETSVLLENLPTASKSNEDSDEIVRYFHFAKFCLELESGTDGFLNRVNLYPHRTDEAGA